jgi:hypothetical protein
VTFASHPSCTEQSLADEGSPMLVADIDRDGLWDGEEEQWGTNWRHPDTDLDGDNDGYEVNR